MSDLSAPTRVTALPRAFWHLMLTRSLYTFATQMQAIVVGWTVYALTHSPVALGLVGLAEAVPALGLALTAGDQVDRSDPLVLYRRVLWGSTVGAALLTAAFFVRAPSALLLLMALYGVSMITGVARAYSQPAMFVLVPHIVPKHDLGRSAASMSASMQVARVAGPAFGGLAYAGLGAPGALGIVLGVSLLAQAMLARVRVPALARAPVAPGQSGRRLLEGLRYVWGEPVLLGALTLDMVSVLFGGVTALLPIYADEVLHVGSTGLGFLRASPAVGATLAALVLGRVDVRPYAGRALLAAVAGFGLCVLGFALSRDALLSGAFLALSGAFDGISMLVRTLILQLRSPDAMRGRISSVNSMFVGSSNELGELESGLAAARLGTVPSAIFGGVMCLVTVAVMAACSRTLRTLNLNVSGPTS